MRIIIIIQKLFLDLEDFVDYNYDILFIVYVFLLIFFIQIVLIFFTVAFILMIKKQRK
jgi:hypothetical protein